MYCLCADTVSAGSDHPSLDENCTCKCGRCVCVQYKLPSTIGKNNRLCRGVAEGGWEVLLKRGGRGCFYEFAHYWFLDAPSHLYKRVCKFVCPSVCPSVRGTVPGSVHGFVSIKEKRGLGASYVGYPTMLFFMLRLFFCFAL